MLENNHQHAVLIVNLYERIPRLRIIENVAPEAHLDRFSGCHLKSLGLIPNKQGYDDSVLIAFQTDSGKILQMSLVAGASQLELIGGSLEDSPMMNDLTYQNVTRRFIDFFPELKMKIGTNGALLAEDGPHMFFGFVAGKILPGLFEDETRNSALLKRIFEFFEFVASDKDENVRGIVGLSVCEEVASNEVVLQKSRRYAGINTLKLCDELLGDE